jgi:5'-3' exoribonuclease 2
LFKNKEFSFGLKDRKVDMCEHCLVGKQTRVSFKHNDNSRKNDVLELVHWDVCGPLKVRSIGGALYFVTFIDDYSRKPWVQLIKTKDQVFNAFKTFHASA